MAVPHTINDGNYRIPGTDGAPSFSFPFMDVGDAVSFEAVVSYSQDQASFLRPALMDTVRFVLGDAFRVGISDVRYSECGILKWTETFASLPRTRDEGMSYPYTQQYLTISSTNSITETTWTNPGFWRYEYFTSLPLPLRRNRIVIIGTQTWILGPLTMTPFDVNQLVIADDSTVEIYKAGIYVRKTPYVYPNVLSMLP